tara:strand:+ start:514 stop:1137 length:624 start_codon:yes stop_codon:yes gene_type:complete
MSEIKVDKISPQSGTAFTIGNSGDTFTVPSGATIVNSGTATGFGGGKIGQVLQTVKTDVYTSSSSTWNIIGSGGTELKISITPVATDSKILVFWTVPVSSSNASVSQHFALHLGGSLMTDAVGDASSSRAQTTQSSDSYGAGDKANRVVTGQFLDSPGVTSACEYSVYMRASTSGGTTIQINQCSKNYDNDDSGMQISTITAMEVLV